MEKAKVERKMQLVGASVGDSGLATLAFQGETGHSKFEMQVEVTHANKWEIGRWFKLAIFNI